MKYYRTLYYQFLEIFEGGGAQSLSLPRGARYPRYATVCSFQKHWYFGSNSDTHDSLNFKDLHGADD